MFNYFSVLLFFVIILPNISTAQMTQNKIDEIYATPVILEDKQKTINIGLPVDSINGYRWFLISTNYDYIRAVEFDHKSADIENSEYGGMDYFKLSVHDRFKKIPQKIVLHFECLQPFDLGSEPIVKDITILSLGKSLSIV